MGFTLSSNDGDMGGIRSLTQKALHSLSGQRVVSLQEAVFMVDDQPLILTSDRMTYLSLHKAQELRREADGPAQDVISKYRNRPKKHHKYPRAIFLQRILQGSIERRNESLPKETQNTGANGNELQTLLSSQLRLRQRTALTPQALDC